MTIVRNTIKTDAYAKVTLTGSTPAITKSSSNVTSITDRAVGRFTMNMTALPSADYSIGATAIYDNTFAWIDTASAVPISTTAFPIATSVNGVTLVDRSFSFIITGA